VTSLRLDIVRSRIVDHEVHNMRKKTDVAVRLKNPSSRERQLDIFLLGKELTSVARPLVAIRVDIEFITSRRCPLRWVTGS
jgi:hypothetical protein